MKRRYVFLGLMIIFTLFINISNVRALDNSCYISSDAGNLVAGSTISVDLYLNDIDVDINQGYIEIEYDGNVLEYIEAKSYEGFNLEVIETTNNLVLNLSGSYVQLVDIEGDLVLANLTFMVKDGVKNQTTKITMHGLNTSYVGNDDTQYYCMITGNSTLNFNIYDGDNDANLSSLTISGGNLNPEFSPDITDYSIDVSYEVKSISLSAKCVSSGCVVTGIGTKGLSVGKNTYKIVVFSKSLITKTYTVTVNREKNISKETKQYVKDNNANLKTLEVSEGELSPKFSSDVTKYVADVSSDVKSIKISGICSGIECTVSGTGVKYLSEGENSYDIKVTAEDGTIKIYNIIVNRAYGLYLSSLLINNYSLIPSFDKDILEYKIDVDDDIDSLDIRVEANDTNTDIRVVGNNNFQEGLNEVTIYLTSSDGKETKSYKIIVDKASLEEDAVVQESESTSIWDNGYVIVLGIVVGCILLGLIAFVVYYLIRKHNKIMEGK